jgi:ATP-dependent Lon protease
MNINLIKDQLNNFLNKNINNSELLKEILVFIEGNIQEDIYSYLIKLERTVCKIQKKNNEVIEYITDFNKILDNAVHGHNNAKKQIERVLGQWINGEKTGYCFGFEGPPGLGKTTLAKKGIANCLKDINNDSRPFSFIALGGSSNGSILDGHNYTYVGSTWGKIVDILIDKKCMNPIIFIDELDKVSRTEHGKEIIGILTHLIDSTQNDIFQDKYFGNVDLDLSKALFIFSYNDVDLIDKILLDRIHRIKFDNLILEDKIIICERYLLPELYKKFGIENIINIDENVIIYLIEKYTNEPGVRKLKEILYEIISTINLDLLKKKEKYDIPYIVTQDIVNYILKDKNIIKYLSINTIPKIGIINGLWANSYGNGGILHIEAKYFLTNTLFDFKLTGMQGDIMKESMAVAKTLAISLINKNRLNSLLSEFEQNKFQGIHIHVPEGATPKDGPSAGAAITLVLYSLLTNKKIKNNYAITGEICLQGNITAIGGLDLKILGGLKAGVTSFLYPKDNNKDFRIFYEKHKDKLDNIDFYEVQNINEALKYIII